MADEINCASGSLLYDYFDAIMESLCLHKRIDLPKDALPIGLINCHGRDARGKLITSTEDFLVKSIEYLSENAYVLDVISLVKREDVSQDGKLQFWFIPGTERRIELHRDKFLVEPPFLNPFSLILIARAVRRMVEKLDREHATDDPDSLRLSDELDRYCQVLYADAIRPGRRKKKSN